MNIIRHENERGVSLRTGDDPWSGHSISCPVADLNLAGPIFHKPGRVRISPMSFGDGSPSDLRAYARDLLELADIADALQAEMTARYAKEYGGG